MGCVKRTGNLGMIEWIFLGIVLFFSAMVIGVGGFGFNIMLVAFLPLLWPVKFVIPFSINYSVLLNLWLFSRCYRHLRRQDITPILVGILLGVPLGVFLLKSLDEWVIKKAIGVFLLLYCFLSLASLLEIKRKLSPRWGYLAGFLAGGLGGAFGIGGPPTVVYTTAQRMEKYRARVIILASSVFVYALVIPLYLVSGLISGDILWVNIWFAPLAALGVFWGHRLFLKINHEIYRKIILILLMIQGGMLLILS